MCITLLWLGYSLTTILPLQKLFNERVTGDAEFQPQVLHAVMTLRPFGLAETIDTYLKQIQNVDCHMMLLFCKSATFVRLTNIEKYLYCDLFIQCEETV